MIDWKAYAKRLERELWRAGIKRTSTRPFRGQWRVYAQAMEREAIMSGKSLHGAEIGKNG